jgi:hypothetical protein
MTAPNDCPKAPIQPPLSQLMARYLERRAAAQPAELAGEDLVGEVVPFEAVPVQPVDPRLAWDEARAVLHCFAHGASAAELPVPPDWAALVVGYESVASLALCLGNFPQLVRNLRPLLGATDLTALRTAPTRPVPASGLLSWAASAARRPRYPELLLVAGALRLARHYDRAAELLDGPQGRVPKPWREAWANEKAALAWHRGRAEEAAALWQAQPQSAPVHFNRGMAALFLNRPADARAELARAVEQLSEDGAWHHLGRLYLALAEMRN